MTRLLASELLLVLLTGLFAAAGIPWLMGLPTNWSLFLVGFMMAMAYVAMYALANLGGKRLSATAKAVVGTLAYAAAFWGPLLLAASRLQQGSLPIRTAYTHLAGPLFGLLLALVASMVPRAGQKPGAAAADALYAFAAPMLMVRYLLVPLLGASPVAQLVALQCGAIYLLGRGLVRLVAPTSAEGNLEAGPLVYRPIPDRVVGLVEAQSRSSARPYFTRADGTQDEQGISLLCRPDEAEALVSRLQQALEGQPFAVQPGERVGEKVELVIRPVVR